ncbi:unnamed protein product [Cyprideis torosa]|uniref:Uncharacterized protein n=1 Tax=Cyprideis torosa TaxID=163714 RepID=A0A7R8WLQ4_9CRUS|nr:unnamed protein product [Cyprideis torosa]CAG0904592.1 unnamed protein product [Cyprideis torosa]
MMKAVFLLVVLVGFAAAAERHVSVDDVCKWMEEHDACDKIGGLNEEATAKFCEAAAERGYSIGSENCQQERIPFMERVFIAACCCCPAPPPPTTASPPPTTTATP